MGTNGKEREEIPRDRGAVGRSRPTLALLALPDPSADSALDITPGFGVSLRAVQRVYVTRPPLVGAVARVRLDGGPPAGRHSRARSEVGRARARVDRGLAGILPPDER